MITQANLQRLLNYDPETGNFTWLISAGRRVKAGDIAGSIDSKGYCRIRIDSRRYSAHRLAWLWVTGAWPAADIDHIDMNRANNAFINLRDATRSQNKANIRAYSNNLLGIKGVAKRRNGYVARICKGGVGQYLGYFATIEEAHDAYAAAATALFGEFARAS